MCSTDVGTVTLEALCSSDGAGVRWTAHDIPLQPDLSEIDEIDLRYSCTNLNVSCIIGTAIDSADNNNNTDRGRTD